MDCTAETPTIPACSSKFSAETASEMGKRSVEVRKARREAEKARISAMEAENALAKPIVDVLKAVTSADVLPTVQASPHYVLQRLTRTRAQIEALDVQLLASDDPRAIQAISVAIRNLTEIERVLAGRPLPGSHRPVRERPMKRVTGQAPVDAAE